MKIGIMQPTYLPWAGYFNLISSVGEFVFLDDVQFDKRSWQQRNRILLNGQAKFLTIPVMNKGKRTQRINKCLIDNSQKWNRRHIETVKHAYGKHPYGAEVISIIETHLAKPDDKLVTVLVSIISEICQKLGVETPFRFSSTIPVSGRKSEYLLNICEYLDADEYLSAAGSREYIENEALFSTRDVSVTYQNFVPEAYSQFKCSDFTSHLSIIDVIANLGFTKTMEYIRG